MTHIFQMRFALMEDYRLGWVLADEDTLDNEAQSFCYVIPWRPDISFEQTEAVLVGTRRGVFAEFPLTFTGNLFSQAQTGLRFALNDPLSPQDFRGLPFLRTFPYIGSRKDVLAWYGIDEFFAFLPIIPLDLIKMDQLYLEEKIVFVGITSRFGMHVTENQKPQTPKKPIAKPAPHEPKRVVNVKTIETPKPLRSDAASNADVRVYQGDRAADDTVMELLRRAVGRPSRNASPILIRQLKREGWSFRKIAQATGLGYGTVRKVFSQGVAQRGGRAGTSKEGSKPTDDKKPTGS